MNAFRDVRADLVPVTARRLRERRIQLGFHSARAFAATHGINPTTYQHHENGRRSLSMDQLKKYASLLGVHTNALLTDTPPANNTAHVIGHVDGAGVVTLDDHFGAGQTIPMLEVPDFSGFMALTVQGDDLYPAYQAGDVVFHRQVNPTANREAELHGRDCVVDLPDGRRLLRTVIYQSTNRFALLGYSLPPLADLTLLGAAPVEFVQRGIQPALRAPATQGSFPRSARVRRTP